MRQSNTPHKVFSIERLRLVAFEGRVDRRHGARIDDLEYRIGYWVVGRIGRSQGRWVWAQFCPMVPAADLRLLWKKASRERVFDSAKRRARLTSNFCGR